MERAIEVRDRLIEFRDRLIEILDRLIDFRERLQDHNDAFIVAKAGRPMSGQSPLSEREAG